MKTAFANEMNLPRHDKRVHPHACGENIDPRLDDFLGDLVPNFLSPEALSRGLSLCKSDSIEYAALPPPMPFQRRKAYHSNHSNLGKFPILIWF
jgi:hypothetical protein